MNLEAKELYKDYWVGEETERTRRAYYERLYRRVSPKICRELRSEWRILDVAGGNGQFMRALGIDHADILDVSQSGLQAAREAGFNPIFGDVEKRFPVSEESYDAVFCCEVLEHLRRPNKTLSEIHHALKTGGILYIAQPNMRADGVHHVRRYYPSQLLGDLEKCGFGVKWIDYVPAYSMRDSILSDIRKNPSWIRKAVQCANLCLSFLPWGIRYRMAHLLPSRFALLAVVKAIKC